MSSEYRRKIFTKEVEETLKKICAGIGLRYEIYELSKISKIQFNTDRFSVFLSVDAKA